MSLNPINYSDWEIAKDAEKTMSPIIKIAEKFGVESKELLMHGHYIAKIDQRIILERLKNKQKGKYIGVTAITPTPLGEGKSTTTIGLVDGLARRGFNSSAAIRQPSGGPTMGIKGSAAGGGLSQCIPLAEFSLGFTGDINSVMNAHNLAMVALTSRMQHERNYDDEKLLKLSGYSRLDVDPTKVQMGWVMDYCCQALRNIIIGIDGANGNSDGFMMRSRFDIAVSSELMAILAIAKDLKDMRARIGKIIVAYSKTGKSITTEDLRVAGAMSAWMMQAINPSLIQTLEGQPVLVHAGPFANIAIGQSSIIADQIGVRLSDYHVTESGFGADIGFEKFWNIKCPISGLVPNAIVVVATIRALKCHGGAPTPRPGRPLPEVYSQEHIDWVEKGCENLIHHVGLVKKAGTQPVVCINAFTTDTPNEIKRVKSMLEAIGVRVAVSHHWAKGGEGALELADAVIDACDEPQNFKTLYDYNSQIHERIEIVAREVYCAKNVTYSPKAEEMLKKIQADSSMKDFGMCMVKTHLSISDNPELKGAPKDWTLYIRDVLIYAGAALIVPVAGTISLMPGTGSSPGFAKIDIDTDNGRVEGLY